MDVTAAIGGESGKGLAWVIAVPSQRRHGQAARRERQGLRRLFRRHDGQRGDAVDEAVVFQPRPIFRGGHMCPGAGGAVAALGGFQQAVELGRRDGKILRGAARPAIDFRGRRQDAAKTRRRGCRLRGVVGRGVCPDGRQGEGREANERRKCAEQQSHDKGPEEACSTAGAVVVEGGTTTGAVATRVRLDRPSAGAEAGSRRPN